MVMVYIGWYLCVMVLFAYFLDEDMHYFSSIGALELEAGVEGISWVFSIYVYFVFCIWTNIYKNHNVHLDCNIHYW